MSRNKNRDYDPWGILPPKRRKTGFAPWDSSDYFASDANGNLKSEWVVIHPSPRTRMFKEILLGEFGYTEGQGVYNSVRSTETAIRQIQATILTNTLDAVRYEDLRTDWEEHAVGRGADPETLAAIYGQHSEAEAVKVAEKTFETWKTVLRNALLDTVRRVAACFSSGEHDSAVSFSKYIDWICCLGMVPMIRNRKRASSKEQGFYDPCRDSSADLREPRELAEMISSAKTVLSKAEEVARELSDCIESVSIMEYDRAIIEYNFNKREVRTKDAVTGERGECIIIWRPVMRNGGVIFDSPLQRLFSEVMACHALRRHVDVCRAVNTAPVKVVLGKRSEDERGIAGARKAVERALGEGPEGKAEAAASSASARLVRLIMNMKGMKHVGDITDTVKAYLEETDRLVLNSSIPIDTSQAGFGRANRPSRSGLSGLSNSSQGGNSNVMDAFHSSVISNINNMLEGYVNKLFSTVEDLKAANGELGASIKRKDAEIWRLRREALEAKQSEVDARAEAKARCPYGPDWMLGGDASAAEKLSELGKDVIDVSGEMSDETYVANSFQSRYVPAYEADISRLSALWEQELIRCFKMTRLTNNQGQETSVSYSNSAITLLVAPYFSSVLRVKRLGFLVTTQEAYRSEEELCSGIFEKSRLETYLQDLGTIFVADVKKSVATTIMGHHGRDPRANLGTEINDTDEYYYDGGNAPEYFRGGVISAGNEGEDNEDAYEKAAASTYAHYSSRKQRRRSTESVSGRRSDTNRRNRGRQRPRDRQLVDYGSPLRSDASRRLRQQRYFGLPSRIRYRR